MVTHSKDFPALPALHAAAEVGVASIDIAAGTPLDATLMSLASAECKSRRLLKTMGLATDDEVGAARLRRCALEAEYASAAFPPPYPWRKVPPDAMDANHDEGVLMAQDMYHRAVDVMAAARETDDFARKMGAMADDFAAGVCGANQRFEADQVFIRADLDEDPTVDVNAMERNVDKRTDNGITVKAIAAEGANRDFPLWRFEKVSTQVGAGVIPRRAGAPVLPVVAIREVIPSPPFPETYHAISRMSKHEINDLTIVMNDSFGIRATDSLAVWQRKLRTALTDYP